MREKPNIPLFFACVALFIGACVERAFSQTMNGVTPIVTSAGPVATLVAKAARGSQLSVYATNTTSTAGFLVGYNAVAAPADGALDPALVLECVPLQATPGYASVNDQPGPTTNYTIGITYILTSAATCYTKTTGTLVGFIKAKVQ